MQRKSDPKRSEVPDDGPIVVSEQPAAAGPQRGCYGVQILIAGRRKHWRDCVSAQVRLAGFNATTVDSAVDALTVLALGLPVDVLLTDADLHGDLCCSQLASEARMLRPNLGIILAGELDEDEVECVPDALVLAPKAHRDGVATSVREVLASRAA